MRKFLIAVLVGLGLVVGAAVGPAAAHEAGPCTPDEDIPGHSEFAEHHIVFNAHEQKLGAHGHAPGVVHQGYSTCR